MMEQLMCRFAETRAGVSIENLKKHEWYTGYDWDALINDGMIPPYTPDLGNNLDDLNHNTTHLYDWDAALCNDSRES